jgi:hypothetical protein
MKVAICFSGQVRPDTFQKSYDSIYNNIIKHHNPDIFVHSWLDNGKDAKELIIKTYNPKKIILEECSEKIPYKNYIPMFKSIFESNKLKKQYEVENNFKYDVVIRLRFDIMIQEIQTFSPYDMNKLNINKTTMFGKEWLVDIFAFGSSEIMNIYSDLINNIDSTIKMVNENNQTLCGEVILTNYIMSQSVDFQYTNLWFGLTRDQNK